MKIAAFYVYCLVVYVPYCIVVSIIKARSFKKGLANAGDRIFLGR